MEMDLMELHLIKLHSINCCFDIFSFQAPIKINKNTANAYTFAITWIPNKTFTTCFFVNEFFAFTSAFIFILFLFNNT